MPRQSGTAVVNNFVKGLITEATALSFPENACTEVNNIVFDPTGRITRRKGFDLESEAVELSYGTILQDVYTTFVWNSVAGDGNVSFLVSQCGNTLRFYNISETTNISNNKHATQVDLTTFLATNSDRNSAYFECSYAVGNGDLFVTNPTCDPFYVTYDLASDSLTATEILLEYRDFTGLDDGLEIDERPTSTVVGLETSNPDHYYNLLNQGWDTGSALSQWDTARVDLPSNADYVALTRATVEDAFDAGNVDEQTPGNRPAPKGHFVLEVSTDNRQQVLDDAGFTFIISSTSNSLIDPSTGTVFSNFSVSPSNAFDGNISQASGDCAREANTTSRYIGKNFGASPKTVSGIRIYPSNDIGFLNDNDTPLVITLYGKNSLPASGTDGTSLGSVSVNPDSNSLQTISSNDPLTEYQYVWCNLVPNIAGTNDDIFVAELQIFSGSLTFERPSCVEFYAGRVFYGGINVIEKSNNIYFTQIIEGKQQYGYCYSKNDPTSEQFPDLLPDDGGVIKILEMGTLRRLFAYQNALLAFASNGIWLISGSTGSNFKADDYVVKKISSIGITSPQSLSSIKGLPAWWGEDGIYTVTFDPNYDSFTPTSLTLTILDRFYQEIPLLNKKFAKGAYDETNQIAYWIFSTDTNLSTDVYQYDSVLCLDGKSKAWYTWEISAGPIVRSINYIKTATRTTDAKLKFLINTVFDGTVTFTSLQTWAEVINENYIDWESFTTSVDYVSSFVTGYRLDGQTQRYFQPNYVFVFLEAEENASCFMQGIFDFTTSSAEGKWSTRQQVYNENLTNRGVNFRKLRVRGKGRALQLKFESEEQKPFTIIGWSIYETSNAGL